MDTAVAAIRRAVHQVDPAVVVQQPQTLEDLMYESVAQPRFRTILLTTFAGMALLLAAIGIYGVIAYSVAQRSNEIGVRMALGAGRDDVVRMVVEEGMRLTVFGLAIGVVAAIGLTRFLAEMLYGVRTTDVPTFIATAALLLIVALAACTHPAWRAARVDPITTLRRD
jgi:putative ABC transport system permease protein